MGSTSEFDDDEDFTGLYENGHWEWDEKEKGLAFIPDPDLFAEESWMSPPAAAIGGADFKDDIDLVEQLRFKKAFARKTFDGDVVKLQDIKDIVLYTAPPVFLNPSIIHLMHLPGTDRFLRALILYHQYYLQVADEMSKRMLELEVKVRTPYGDIIEKEYKENLDDLRLLITKEYSAFAIGSGEYKKFHHMGPAKDRPSLSKKGNILFETLIRLSIQVVWLALGRKSFNQIELEMHRLFKTEKYNMVEHKLKSNYAAKMSPQERYVLFGSCVHNDRKVNICSPLRNESCKDLPDWRLLGIGVFKYPNLGRRLKYMQDALTLPEMLLEKKRIIVGILGLARSRFDTMLKEITFPVGTSSTSMVGGARTSVFRKSISRATSRVSRVSTSRKSIGVSHLTIPDKLIPDIEFPTRETETEWLPIKFPDEYLPQNSCDLTQRRKWLARATRLALKRARRLRRTNRAKK
ncbi:uncharacterized protein LOC128669530 isoform X1 [Plodia interpunctella]|uniref:uncharacterized protein LOC128669530 isoform X1 n=1 Tax=Plodia interpunctella TaxID=58824 RepID=UPI002367E8EA|nr:uncharacterized protein LOC128669530 isoform X1 [Plodia interpunctella]